MALKYGSYTAQQYLDRMSTAQKAKLFNMEGMAYVQAGLKTWTDKFVKDIVNSLPSEQYLDQTKTEMIPSFNWATMSTNYPGATNPNLDDKPVLVFAVVGKPVKSETDTPDIIEPDTETVSYSFLNLEQLIDVYSEDNSGKNGVDITISGNKISAELKISSETNNIAKVKDGSLYVPEFDDSDITDRLDDLESIVGEEADEANSTPATGLVKKVADNAKAIGNATTYKKDTDGITDIVDVAGTGLTKRIEDLEADLDSLSGGAGSISTQINNAIQALDATVTNVDAVANPTPVVTVSIEEADGVLTSVSASLDVAQVIGVKADASASTPVAATGMYKYVDDAVGAVQSNLVYASSADIAAIFA